MKHEDVFITYNHFSNFLAIILQTKKSLNKEHSDHYYVASVNLIFKVNMVAKLVLLMVGNWSWIMRQSHSKTNPNKSYENVVKFLYWGTAPKTNKYLFVTEWKVEELQCRPAIIHFGMCYLLIFFPKRFKIQITIILQRESQSSIKWEYGWIKTHSKLHYVY